MKKIKKKIKLYAKAAYIIAKSVCFVTYYNITNALGRLIFPRPYLVTYAVKDEHAYELVSKVIYMHIIRLDQVMEQFKTDKREYGLVSITELPRSSTRMMIDKLVSYVEKQAFAQIPDLKEPPKPAVEEDPDEKEQDEIDEINQMLGL